MSMGAAGLGLADCGALRIGESGYKPGLLPFV